MANANLSAAKKAEFYTQYADIAREMEAYGYSAGGGGAGRPALPSAQMNVAENVKPVGRDVPVAPCGESGATRLTKCNVVGRDVPVAPCGESGVVRLTKCNVVGRDVPVAPFTCGNAHMAEHSAMPSRKRLCHVAPLRVDTRNAAYFITICAANRHDADWTGFCNGDEVRYLVDETCGVGAGRPALPNVQMNATPVGRDVPVAPHCRPAAARFASNATPVGRDVPVAPCGESGMVRLTEWNVVGRDVPVAPHVGHDAAGFAPNGVPVGRDVPVAPHGESGMVRSTECNVVGRDVPVAPHGKGCAASISPPAVHLIDSAKHYHSIGRWFLHLILIMPDHLHMIITPLAADGLDGTDRDVLVAPLQNTIIRWKAYVSRMFGIRFQRDFWDTRIRDAVHFTERCEYVQRNPVRKGLVSEAESWPWKWDCRNEMDVKCNEVG